MWDQKPCSSCVIMQPVCCYLIIISFFLLNSWVKSSLLGVMSQVSRVSEQSSHGQALSLHFFNLNLVYSSGRIFVERESELKTKLLLISGKQCPKIDLSILVEEAWFENWCYYGWLWTCRSHMLYPSHYQESATSLFPRCQSRAKSKSLRNMLRLWLYRLQHFKVWRFVTVWMRSTSLVKRSMVWRHLV